MVVVVVRVCGELRVRVGLVHLVIFSTERRGTGLGCLCGAASDKLHRNGRNEFRPGEARAIHRDRRREGPAVGGTDRRSAADVVPITIPGESVELVPCRGVCLAHRARVRDEVIARHVVAHSD